MAGFRESALSMLTGNQQLVDEVVHLRAALVDIQSQVTRLSNMVEVLQAALAAKLRERSRTPHRDR